MQKIWAWLVGGRWWLTGSAAFGVAGAGYWACVDARLDAQSWAAWVQAFFSVGAIAAAIGIAQWQRHADQRRERERDRCLAYCKLDMLLALADQAIEALDTSLQRSIKWEDVIRHLVTYKQKDATLVASMLDVLGPADVNDGAELKKLMELRSSVGILIASYQGARKYEAVLAGHEYAQSTTADIQNSCEELRRIRSWLLQKRSRVATAD